MTPTRSMLFVPVLNERAVEKSKNLQCDAVILDLEDSISLDCKAQARAAVVDVLQAGGFDAPLKMVRVNDVKSAYFKADITSLAPLGVQAILVPKVNSAADVLAVEQLLNAEPAAKDTQIWIMIETAMGVMNLREICAASSRISGMVVGPNDLVKDLRATETAGLEALLTSYGLCIIAARAFGLICIDGIYKQFTDAQGFVENCAKGKVLGFDGKSLIHPSQIDPANTQYSPNVEAIDLAKRQVKAYDLAKAQGKGVAVVDGELVEGLHADNARTLLKMAEVIAKRAKPEGQ